MIYMSVKIVYTVEDDESIREVIAYALGSAGYEVIGFESGADFFDHLKKSHPNLVILDIMLPAEDGLSILKRLRASSKTKKLPVIMLTAKGSEIDKVKGLDMGADDYISKPFGVMELISRVGAVLRRTSPDPEPVETLEYGELMLDVTRRTVSVSGSEVSLTYKEFELLRLFFISKGKVLSRVRILSDVWGTDFEGESRTLDMHIHSLRQKLGHTGEYIKTIRNVGYKFGE